VILFELHVRLFLRIPNVANALSPALSLQRSGTERLGFIISALLPFNIFTLASFNHPDSRCNGIPLLPLRFLSVLFRLLIRGLSAPGLSYQWPQQRASSYRVIYVPGASLCNIIIQFSASPEVLKNYPDLAATETSLLWKSASAPLLSLTTPA